MIKTYNIKDEYIKTRQTIKKYCPKCKINLIKSDVKEYDFLCVKCDENFYNCEVD